VPLPRRSRARRFIVFAFVGVGIDPVACGLFLRRANQVAAAGLAANGQSGSQAMASTTLSTVLIIAAIALRSAAYRCPAWEGADDPRPNQTDIPRRSLFPIRSDTAAVHADPVYSVASLTIPGNRLIISTIQIRIIAYRITAIDEG
jgi:hypothetical protein